MSWRHGGEGPKPIAVYWAVDFLGPGQRTDIGETLSSQLLAS